MFCVNVTSITTIRNFVCQISGKKRHWLDVVGLRDFNTCITLHEPYILSCTTVVPGIYPDFCEIFPCWFCNTDINDGINKETDSMCETRLDQEIIDEEEGKKLKQIDDMRRCWHFKFVKCYAWSVRVLIGAGDHICLTVDLKCLSFILSACKRNLFCKKKKFGSR